MGFFHAARACPRWAFPHWLNSAQQPIAQGDGAYEFIIITQTHTKTNQTSKANMRTSFKCPED